MQQESQERNAAGGNEKLEEVPGQSEQAVVEAASAAEVTVDVQPAAADDDSSPLDASGEADAGVDDSSGGGAALSGWSRIRALHIAGQLESIAESEGRSSMADSEVDQEADGGTSLTI